MEIKNKNRKKKQPNFTNRINDEIKIDNKNPLNQNQQKTTKIDV